MSDFCTEFAGNLASDKVLPFSGRPGLVTFPSFDTTSGELKDLNRSESISQGVSDTAETVSELKDHGTVIKDVSSGPLTPSKGEDSKALTKPEVNTSVHAHRLALRTGPKSCLQCFSTKTPLWRNGPLGPKTLCNACGIRFNKMKAGKKCRTPFGSLPSPVEANFLPSKTKSRGKYRKRSIATADCGPTSLKAKKSPVINSSQKLIVNKSLSSESDAAESFQNEETDAVSVDEDPLSWRSCTEKMNFGMKDSIKLARKGRAELMRQSPQSSPELFEAADLLMNIWLGPNWLASEF